ncbi:hypothetical protein GOODEAATRI_003148, partial [Goodea atripinnis]
VVCARVRLVSLSFCGRVLVRGGGRGQKLFAAPQARLGVPAAQPGYGLNADDDITRLLGKSSVSNSTSTGNSSGAPASVTSNGSEALIPQLSACVWSIPMLYEELDVLSLRFTPANGSNISITDTQPTLLTFPLPTQVTGGTLNLQLTLNSVSNAESLTCLCVCS